MGTRSKRAQRCRICRMHQVNCICDLIPRLELSTRVVVVMHYREWSKSTATAPLFALTNDRCEIRIRGRKDAPFNPDGIIEEGRRTMLMFPRDDAAVLTKELIAKDPRPITLVVPDGNWRQASKMAQREPSFARMEHVILPDMGPSRYRLRNEPKPGGLATFEAISRALRLIEGEEVYQQLDALFTAMVERTLLTRGRPEPATPIR